MSESIRSLNIPILMMAFLLAGIATPLAQELSTKPENDGAKEAKAISEFLSSLFPGEVAGGRNLKVADVLDQAVAKLETNKTIPPARRAMLQRSLASTYRDLGLYRQAITLLEAARNYHLATSGPEHPDTLEAMSALAQSYRAAGRLDEAIKMGAVVLALSPKILGPEHPNTLQAMSELASSYCGSGREDEAIALLQEVLKLSRKVLGAEHPRTRKAAKELRRLHPDGGTMT